MKKLLIILSIASLYACTKCVNCKRTWTTETYNVTNGVTSDYYLSPVKEEEYFNVCGSDEVKNAEQPTTILTTMVDGEVIHYIRKKSTCNCTTE